MMKKVYFIMTCILIINLAGGYALYKNNIRMDKQAAAMVLILEESNKPKNKPIIAVDLASVTTEWAEYDHVTVKKVLSAAVKQYIENGYIVIKGTSLISPKPEDFIKIPSPEEVIKSKNVN